MGRVLNVSLVEEATGWCVYSLEGEATDQGKGILEEHLVRKAASPGVRTMILRCRSLLFMDSCGMGMLFRVYASLKRKGGSLILCELNPNLKQLLSVARFNRLIPDVGTFEEAMELGGVARQA